MNYPVFKKWIRVVVTGIVICCLQQPTYAQVRDSINLSNKFILDTIKTPKIEQVPFEEKLVDEYIDYDAEKDISDEEEKKRTFLVFDSAQLLHESQQFKLRSTPDSTKVGLKKNNDFWYADLAFGEEKKEQEYKGSFWTSNAFFVLLTVIAVITFAALLMIYLGDSSRGVFRRNRHIVRQADSEDGISEDIFAIAYEREIFRAEQAKDFRLATRLHFLQLLKEMSDRNIIRYLDERTNLDYLTQLHQTALYDDFLRLTRHYEYSWYGLFEVGEEQYTRIKSDFKNMHKRFY